MSSRYGTKPPDEIGNVVVNVGGRYGSYIPIKSLEPFLLDCSIDIENSTLYARSDLDHQVYLPSGQKLEIDLETGILTTQYK